MKHYANNNKPTIITGVIVPIPMCVQHKTKDIKCSSAISLLQCLNGVLLKPYDCYRNMCLLCSQEGNLHPVLLCSWMVKNMGMNLWEIEECVADLNVQPPPPLYAVSDIVSSS